MQQSTASLPLPLNDLPLITLPVQPPPPPANPANSVARAFGELGFELVDVPLDGNCLFSSIAHLLNLNLNLDVDHAFVRTTITMLMRELLEKDDSITHLSDEYITNMEKLGTWGDGTVIEVAAMIWDVVFLVYTDPKKRPMSVHRERNAASRTTLRLYWSRQRSHYTPLISARVSHARVFNELGKM